MQSTATTHHQLRRQHSLRQAICCVGTGLHKGTRVSMTLRPGPVDSGIHFLRDDRPGSVALPALFDRVSDTRLSTTLAGRDGTRVATVEHLMAAFAACGIDNAVVELSGGEVPIMDGSAQPFVFLMECAGVVEQDAPRRFIQILRPIRVEEGSSSVELLPGVGFTLNACIAFDHPVIGEQALTHEFSVDGFKGEVADARTFGFAEQLEQLRAQGLALGGSLENAVAVCANGVLNPEGLRYPDEFVRHKVLDAVGDLYLSGSQIIGEYRGVRAGHTVHNKLLRALFANPGAWRWVEQDEAGTVLPMVDLPATAAAS
ncbi:MAG: UDP-3-O-acyl-N-acetylglucosamine deacetylase [Geminicoccaceae bacterium]